jgi:hypothetical protein
MRFGVLLFFLLLPSAHALAHEALLPAPYQVEGLVRFKNDRYRLDDGLGLNSPLVVVDLGEARDAPHPGSGRFQTMTIIGSTGIGLGKLHDIRKTCDYLCGDDGQECHYEALFMLDKPVETIGTPLAAIPGVQVLTGFLPATPGGPQAEAGFPAGLLGEDFSPLAWTPHGRDGPQLRITGWDSDQRKLDLEARWRTGDSFMVEAPECRLRRVGELTEMQCNGAALVLTGGAPLLFSYPDYNAAAAEVVATFEFGKSTLYLVRLGLKAQTVFGLLYGDKEGWRGLFRPRDYALLC